MFTLLTLFACGTDYAQTLEAPTADLSGCEDEAGCVSERAALSVATGAEEGDWTLGAGEMSLAVHLPGHSDLSAFQGVEATVAIGALGVGALRSATLEDDAGLAFLLASSPDDALVVAHFGEGFVRFGEEELGTGTTDASKHVFHPAVFVTDSGEVSVAPGEPTVLSVGGTLFRVVVIASYASTDRPLAADEKCGGPQDLLTFEMLRVDAEAEEDLIVRPAEKEMASNGCG